MSEATATGEVGYLVRAIPRMLYKGLNPPVPMSSLFFSLRLTIVRTYDRLLGYPNTLYTI